VLLLLDKGILYLLWTKSRISFVKVNVTAFRLNNILDALLPALAHADSLGCYVLKYISELPSPFHQFGLLVALASA
jgi:hypothetical protein